jgi:hypothetical protein
MITAVFAWSKRRFRMKKISRLLALFVVMLPIAALAGAKTVFQTLPTNWALIDQFAKPPARYTAVNGALFKNGVLVTRLGARLPPGAWLLVGNIEPGFLDYTQIPLLYSLMFVSAQGNNLVLRFIYASKLPLPQLIGPIAAPVPVAVYVFTGGPPPPTWHP